MKGTVCACLAAVLAVAGPARADDQTDARKIIEKAIAAHGGNEALAKHPASTTKMKGKWYGMGDGLDYTGSFGIQAPDRFHVKIEMNVMGQAVTML